MIWKTILMPSYQEMDNRSLCLKELIETKQEDKQ